LDSVFIFLEKNVVKAIFLADMDPGRQAMDADPDPDPYPPK
jgi:hypothetical protein